jgi:hypothetical protein
VDTREKWVRLWKGKWRVYVFSGVCAFHRKGWMCCENERFINPLVSYIGSVDSHMRCGSDVVGARLSFAADYVTAPFAVLLVAFTSCS